MRGHSGVRTKRRHLSSLLVNDQVEGLDDLLHRKPLCFADRSAGANLNEVAQAGLAVRIVRLSSSVTNVMDPPKLGHAGDPIRSRVCMHRPHTDRHAEASSEQDGNEWRAFRIRPERALLTALQKLVG